MTIEIRPPAEDELRSTLEAAEAAFGAEVEEQQWEREQKILPASRALAAFDRGRPVGLAAAYAFDLSIPGGELPCAGVTWVGVLPTHRRRGILRDFMRRQLEDVHGWGEPVAALWASEASIYGRFGYGSSAPGIAAKSDLRRFALRDHRPGNVTVRLG
jgi:predicted acetyltransferase